MNEIEALLQNPCVVALGEIGLDYYWEDVPHDKQKDIFQKQTDIAKNMINLLLFMQETPMKILIVF